MDVADIVFVDFADFMDGTKYVDIANTIYIANIYIYYILQILWIL